MNKYVALVRGINVGGNNILSMVKLKSLCEEAGFKNVRTYIQSGNVLFESNLSEEKAIRKMESVLESELQKPISIVVRTIEEVQEILSANPFPTANPAHVGVLLLAKKIDPQIVNDFSGKGAEEIIPGIREIFIHYPIGMGKSKLKFAKIAAKGTVRNINTIGKLVELGMKK